MAAASGMSAAAAFAGAPITSGLQVVCSQLVLHCVLSGGSMPTVRSWGATSYTLAHWTCIAVITPCRSVTVCSSAWAHELSSKEVTAKAPLSRLACTLYGAA